MVDNELLGIPLHIGKWTITEAVDRAVGVAKKTGAKIGHNSDELDDSFVSEQAKQLYPLISLLLYVCSDGVEYRASNQPSNPAPKRTRRHGWRLFPAPHPRVWNLGDKTGEALESALSASKVQEGERKAVRPHIRRAHWHTFYAGPRDAEEREVRVKWIPPLLVGS